jgi:alginate O-acetyltransferase complex protein AlgI
MNFNNAPFLVLLCITFAAYYMPVRAQYWQISVLLVASLTFYGWQQPYLLSLLLFCAAMTSLASYQIAHEMRPWPRRWIAIAAVTAMLLVLAFFKYDRLIYQSLGGDIATGPGQWLLTLPLPIGISFYTFHGISLVVDTFNRNDTIKRLKTRPLHFAHTSLYLTFFPQLIAGPIMKARDFLPQIEHKNIKDIDWQAATRALIVGYFLKLVVADNLAVLTSGMSADHAIHSSYLLVTSIFAYSCQIFADFAGYSLIAIGLASLFGYRLMTNFNFPYLAESFSDFWHRWHISLSTWLRDYLYIPLGGGRQGAVRTSINIMIVMLLGGLWHGAAWSYTVWGGAHGLALVLERPFLASRFYTSRSVALRIIRTLLVVTVVSFAWLLFRLPDFTQARDYMAALITNYRLFTGGEVLVAMLIYGSPVIIYHLIQTARISAPDSKWQVWKYATLAFAIALNSGVPGAFIYFQF